MSQHRYTSQKIQVERWAAEFSRKLYTEHEQLIDQLCMARQEIAILENTPIERGRTDDVGLHSAGSHGLRPEAASGASRGARESAGQPGRLRESMCRQASL